MASTPRAPGEPWWRRQGWPLAGLATYAVFLLHEAVLFGRVFYERDVQLVWYGQAESFVRAVASGAWPLWDPYLAFGHPLLANPNTQVLYPFTWLNLVLPQGVFYTLYALAHVLAGGLGAWLLARHLGAGRLGAFTAGLVWAGSGPFVSLVNVWHHLAGAALIPWILLATERALERPHLRRAAQWALALGLQVVAGSADMTLMTGGVVLLRVLAAVLARGRSGLPLLGFAALTAVLGLALTAGQWLPTVEAARESARARLDPGMQSAWPVRPLGLGQILTAVSWTELPLTDGAREVLLGGGHPFLRSLYLGLASLPLVLAGALARSRRRGMVLALAVPALLYALGPATPVYAATKRLWPPLELMRYPSKAMVWVALCWSLLAGLGLDALAGGRISRRGRALAGAAAGLASLASAALTVVAWRFPDLLAALMVPADVLGVSLGHALRPAALHVGFAAALAAGAALLVASRRPLLVLLPALAAADLLAAHSRLNKTAPADFYRYRPPVLQLVSSDPLARLFVYRYTMSGAGAHPALGERDPYRVARYPGHLGFDAGRALSARLYPLPPANTAFRLHGSFDADLLGLYPRHLEALVAFHRTLEGTPAWVRLLEAGAVGHMVALHDPGLDGLVPVVSYPSLLAEPIRVLAIPRALPRAYVVSGVRVVDERSALQVLADSRFDPRREVLLQEGQPSPGGAGGTARILEYRADRVRVDVQAQAAAHLVVVDTYAAGWTATVDGAPAPVHRANAAFRAVPVPPGRHTVVLRYRPRSAMLGLGLSFSGAAAIALLWLRSGAIPPLGATERSAIESGPPWRP